MQLWSVVTTVFAFAAMSLATPAMAQDAGAAVKERVAIMKNVSGAMKALAKSAEAGKVGGGGQGFGFDAPALRRHSGAERAVDGGGAGAAGVAVCGKGQHDILGR